MAGQNQALADAFNKIAQLLEIEDENPFRIRAYRKAAETIEACSRDLKDMVAGKEELSQLPGIGKDLAAKIQEWLSTGRIAQLQELEARIPPGVLAFIRLPGLGPKKARLFQKAGITTLAQLKHAAETQKIRALPGFGPKTEQELLEALTLAESTPARTRLADAESITEALITFLKKVPGVREVVAAGSYRRRKETIGDLDLLALAEPTTTIMETFVQYPEVDKILAHGDTKSSVLLRRGLQVDLRVLAAPSFGAGLLYFTGSKTHNIALRTLGVQRNIKINEYGAFHGPAQIAGATEASMYAALDLPYIEPELREDQGEIQAAQAGQLPQLVTLTAICGDLHSHTLETDGQDRLETMAAAARAKGYAYLGITNHSQHVTIARGMDAKRVQKQILHIEQLNQQWQDFRLLKGMEVDILDQGQLDLPDEILAQLDYTVCSIHYKFKLTSEQQTERVLRAMENPYFTIFAHPTGRLLEERPAYAIAMEPILQAARARGCFMELNSDPSRLDLNDVYCRRAKALGVLVAISTDAHSTAGLENLRFGIGQARRGWLEPTDVLNTRPLAELLRLLQQRRRGA